MFFNAKIIFSKLAYTPVNVSFVKSPTIKMLNDEYNEVDKLERKSLKDSFNKLKMKRILGALVFKNLNA